MAMLRNRMPVSPRNIRAIAFSSIWSGVSEVGMPNASPRSTVLAWISRSGTSRRNSARTKPTTATGAAHKKTSVSESA